MNKKTMLPAAVLSAALALLCTAQSQAQTVRYFSPKTEAIVSVNLKQIWDSKLVKDYQALVNQLEAIVGAQVQRSDEAVELQKALGIDPMKDISSVTVGFSDLSKKPKDVLVVMEGSFDADKFSQTAKLAAKKHPGVIRDFAMGNYTTYQITPPNSTDSFFVCLLNKRTLFVAKTKENMTSAIDRAGQIRPQDLKQEVAKLVKSVNLKQSFSFGATSGALMQAIKDSNNPQIQMAGALFRDLHGLNVSANVAKDVKFELGVLAKDAQTAQKLAKETSDGLVGLNFILAQQAGANAKLAPAVDIAKTLRAAANGETMTIRGNVSREVIDNAIKSLENFLP